MITFNDPFNIQVPVREAINMAIDEEMARDEKVFIIGRLHLSLCVVCDNASLFFQVRKLPNTKELIKLVRGYGRSMAQSE